MFLQFVVGTMFPFYIEIWMFWFTVVQLCYIVKYVMYFYILDLFSDMSFPFRIVYVFLLAFISEFSWLSESGYTVAGIANVLYSLSIFFYLLYIQFNQMRSNHIRKMFKVIINTSAKPQFCIFKFDFDFDLFFPNRNLVCFNY